MSEHKTTKLRRCKHCNMTTMCTAKELKEHAAKCGRKNRKAA